MKMILKFVPVLFLGLMAGCTSKGPSFDPYMADLMKRGGGLSDGDSLGDLQFENVDRTNTQHQSMLKVPTDFYRLGPGDIVEIEMVASGNPASRAVVGPDGKVYYSLLSGVFVWGLTISEAKALLEQNLARYLRIQPEVNLTLIGVASKRVWIMGNVGTPGIFLLGTPMTLLEAISKAGGIPTAGGSSEEIADLRNSFVMRDGKLLAVDFQKLFRNGDLTQNIYLQSGDYVYLRPAVARNVYVLGMVRAPNLVRYSQDINLISAIAAAGGPVEYAYLSQVAIVRGSLATPAIATIDFRKVISGKMSNVRLEPGDIVYVPKAPYARLQQFANEILENFVSTVAINEGNNAVLDNATPVGVSIGGGVSGGAAAGGGGGGQ